MGIFYHEELPANPCSKKCKFIAATLKEKFCNCHQFDRQVSTSRPGEEEYQADDEQEVVISAIRSAAMEKMKKKPQSRFKGDNFTWLFSPETGELFIAEKAINDNKKKHDLEVEGEEKFEFQSVKSYFSCCSTMNKEEFVSCGTGLSRCSSMKDIDFQNLQKIDFEEFWRRWSIIEELCHCEGWPFGLCRKAIFLPPLPKSPSESWTWRKGTKIVNLPHA
ncbi:hypothetical protein ACFE04_007656 [Oxalis oulophora]